MNKGPYFTNARYAGKCKETQAAIKRGDRVLYDPNIKVCYAAGSDKYKAAEQQERELAFARSWGMGDANW